jgi:hypothetical protein
MNLIIHSKNMPRNILQDLNFLRVCYDGFEQTLETGSERLYFYRVPQTLLKRAKRVLESQTGVEYIVTKKMNHTFSER